jgi:hypothetical protein
MESDKLLLKDNRNNQGGQALITLIFFVLIASLYITAAVIILITNSIAATRTEQGFTASRLAEGALEDTFLKLIRNPDYAGGSFNLEDGNATVNVTGGTLKDIAVSIKEGNYYRKFQAQVQFNETEMTILSWKEAF